jgi:hypothetical protein
VASRPWYLLSQVTSAVAQQDAESAVQYGKPMWWFYPPETKLASVYGTDAIKFELGVRYVDPVPDREDGDWLYNGSIVSLQLDKNGWRIVYEKPSEVAQLLGIRKGMIIFEGAQTGGAISGKGFVLLQGCNPISYESSGALTNNRQFEIVGEAPQVEGCRITGYASKSLKFEFQPDMTMW